MGNAQNTALSGSGTALNNFLTPALESQATNPQGYTPQQLAYMNTASQQSLGGGASATTGQANLTAARTRNEGGFQGAVGTANRGAQRQLSENALGIQTAQANLQQQQKQEALKALQSLYGVDEATALGYLNSSTGALHAEDQAGNPLINDIEGLGKGLGSLAYGANQGAQAYNAATS